MTKKQIEQEGFEVRFTNGSGKGGQKRNRTYSCAVVKHIESGTTKTIDETRSANKNMLIAYELIRQELEEAKKKDLDTVLNEARKKAAGRGVIRTYDFKRGVAKDMITGKEAPLKKVLNGNIELLRNL